MIINSKFIKFKSLGINIPTTQNIDSNTDYEVNMTVSSNGGTFKNSDDGKTDIYYILTPVSEVEFLNTKSNVKFKGDTKNNSISKKMRGAIYYLYEDEIKNNKDIDFQTFYENFGNKIIKNITEINEYLKKYDA